MNRNNDRKMYVTPNNYTRIISHSLKTIYYFFNTLLMKEITILIIIAKAMLIYL